MYSMTIFTNIGRSLASKIPETKTPQAYISSTQSISAIVIHSFILETYVAPLQETTTQRRSQPSHEQNTRTSERCKIWKSGPSARNTAQRGDHSMMMDPQPKRPFAVIIIKAVP